MKEKDILFDDFDMESGGSGLPEKTAAPDSTAGRLLSRIPGLRADMEAKRWREADQRLRNTLSAQLDQSRLHVSQIHVTLGTDIGRALKYAERLGQIDTRLMGLSGKIRNAAAGETSLFSPNKIDAAALAAVYHLDEEMFADADTIAAAVQALQQAAPDGTDIDIETEINTLDKTIQRATLAFEQRAERLSTVSK